MRSLLALLLVGFLLLGLGSVLVADSPYESNVVSERNPVAPERPATLNRTTAASYLVEYEQTLLYNGLLGSRGFTLDPSDEVRTNCVTRSVNETADGFRAGLRCRGRIVDTKRLVQPPEVSYTVTYSTTEDTVRELAIEGYPSGERGELRERPTAAR
jgi:hypothetical protein